MILKPPKGILLNRNHLLARGLVACWLMNEGGGGRIMDLSGNGNTGTLTAGVAWMGRGLRFAADGQVVQCAKPVLSQTSGTVALCICRNAALLEFSTFLNVENATNNSPHEMVLGPRTLGGNPRFYPNLDQDSGDYWDFGAVATALPLGTPRVLACTWNNGANLAGYLDGVLSGTLNGDAAWTAAAWANSEFLGIGDTSNTTGANAACMSDIFWVYAWNRRLSAGEVLQVHQDPFAMFRRPRLELWTAAQPVSLPSKATTPSPADAALNVALDATLSWVDGGGAATFDVYLDTVSPPVTEVSHAQAGNTYDPGGLLASTTYYWRIDSTNPAGTTTGDEWSFATTAAGGLKCHPGMGGGINA